MMELEDAFSAFANETLESNQGENVASTSDISAETQTEGFEYLYRKTSSHEFPDVDAETQIQAFDYLLRKSSDSKAPDRDAETQTEEFDYLNLKELDIKLQTGGFSSQMRGCNFTQDFVLRNSHGDV